MKRETKKQMWVLLVVIIFFGSTIAFTISQAFGVTDQQTEPVTIENERIFEQSNNDLENLFVSRGFTIAVLNYDGECCEDIIQYLEVFSEDNNGQIAVFKNKNPGIDQKSLKLSSFVNTVVLINEEITIENVFDNLCNIMLQTPLECGVKFINTTNSSTS